MSRYKTGYRLEHRVERLYSSQGWLATRYPKSGRKIYPADVLAIKRLGVKTIIHLVECKNLSKEGASGDILYIERAQVQKLTETANKHDARALVVYKFPHQRPRITDVKNLRSSGKMLSMKREDGTSLKEFLMSFLYDLEK